MSVPTPSGSEYPDAGEVMLFSRRALGIGTSLFTLAFGAAIMGGALEFSVGWGSSGPEPGYFPFWVGLVVAMGSLATLVQALRAHEEGRIAALTHGQFRRAMAFLLPVVAFVLMAQMLGLYVASLVYLFSVMVFQGKYSVALSALVSGCAVLAFYLMFDVWLKVPLAKGPLEAYLGIH